MESLKPNSQELTGIGPSRALKVREKYNWLNDQITTAIEQAKQARKSLGLSDLSEEEEQRIADKVAAEFRAKEADVGPPSPENLPKTLAAAVRPRKGTSFEEAKNQAQIVRPEYAQKAPASPGESAVLPEPWGTESLMARIVKGVPSSSSGEPEVAETKIAPAPVVEPSTKEPELKKTAPSAPPAPGPTAAAAAPATPKPTAIQGIIQKFQNDVQKIGGKAKKELGGQLEQLSDLENTYRQEAKEAKSDLEKRELAETMGHALAQFGAGLYGMNKGIDMTSGLKFNKTDWNRRYEQALDELKSNLADLREKRQEARLRTTEEAREQIGQAQFGAGLEAQEQMRRESEAAASARARSAQAAAEQEKKLDRESREKIAKIRALSQQSLANQKLGAEEEAQANGALGSLVGAWAAVGEAEGGKEKQQAEKRAMMLESDPKITKYFSPQAIQEARKLAVGTPSNLWNWWSGQEEDLVGAQKALEAGRTSSMAPAAPPTGQVPAPGGKVKMLAPDGRQLEVPADKVKELEAAGAKRV